MKKRKAIKLIRSLYGDWHLMIDQGHDPKLQIKGAIMTTGTSPIEPSTELDMIFARWSMLGNTQLIGAVKEWSDHQQSQVLSELLDSLPKKVPEKVTNGIIIINGRDSGYNAAIDQVTEAIKLKIKELGASDERRV